MRTQLGGIEPLRADQTYLDQIRWTPQSGTRRPLVAILDTGVDGRHRDLDAQIVPRWARSFVDESPLVDRSGHGTHIAGIVAAEAGNGFGGVGVADARLLIVKVADGRGRATTSAVVRGIQYAVERRAKVINLSLGGDGFSRAEQRAILDARRAGVLVVAAAGNTGRQESRREYPGAYAHVLAVAAVRSDNAPIADSTRGPQVAIAAPGKKIVSTWPKDRFGAQTGTSVATAIVTGAAARLLSQRPKLDASQVREMLLRGAHDVDQPGPDDATGWGVLDLSDALTIAPPKPDRQEPDDDAELARALPALLGGPGATAASVEGTVERWADRTDDYRLTLAPGDSLQIDAEGPEDVDLDLVIWRPGAPAFTPGPAYARDWLAATALGPGPTESLTYTATKAGEYTIEVAAAAGRGRYTLNVRRTPEAGPPAT